MHKLLSAIVVSALFQLPLQAAPYTPDDFTYSSVLSDANTSLRELDLPLSVYEKMKRKDYGDLRVFSADGQPVPYQFSRTESVNSTQQKKLVFYPFTKEQAADTGNIRVFINQRAGKQSVSINQQLGGSKPASSKEYQYIIENQYRTRKPSLCKLKLDWTQAKPSMVLALKLEASNNLQNWKSLSRKLTVSKLSYAGSQLVSDEIGFSCSSHKYLRMTWLQPNPQVHLKQIQGIYTANGIPQTQWVSLGKPQYDKEGNWLFESNVIAAFSKMEFVAPQDGLLYKGSLLSRNNENDNWRFRYNVSQYRLNIGDSELQSGAFSLRANNDRFWKLSPTTEGTFTDDQLPEIRAGWAPRKLLFVAQGKGPFQLAFGNPTIKPASGSNYLNDLIKSMKQSSATIDKVTLGEINNSGKSFGPGTPWKLILLWLVLILGTLLMAVMAFKLYKQMGDGQE